MDVGSNIFDGRYYQLVKSLMIVSGLWPYQEFSSRRWKLALIILMYLSVLAPVFLNTIKLWNVNIDLFTENFVTITISITILSRYLASFSNSSKFRILLEQIQEDWNRTIDKKELEILSNHCEQGRLFSLIYTVYFFGSYFGLYTICFMPWVLDRVYPLENGSYPTIKFSSADYIFFEQEDYHYEILLHMATGGFMVVTMVCSQETLYMTVIKHTCGLFAVLCYRLEHYTGSEKDEVNPMVKNKYKTMSYLSQSIFIHNACIRNCELIENVFWLSNMIVESLCLIFMSYGAFFVLYITEDISMKLKAIPILIGSVLYTLYLHWMGQQIINHSTEVFDSAYCSYWYLLPCNEQKSYLLIMNRSLHPCLLTVGKIIILSMETFSNLMKANMSYFMFIESIVDK